MKRIVCFGSILVLAVSASMVFGTPMNSTKTCNTTFGKSAQSAFSDGSVGENAVSKMGGKKKGGKKPSKKSGKNKKNKKHHKKHHRKHHHHRRDRDRDRDRDHDRDRDRDRDHDRDRDRDRDYDWDRYYHRDWPRHFIFSGYPSDVQFVSTASAVADDDEEIEGDFGLIITDLDEDGPAAEAGLDIDDTIISINGVRVQTLEQMKAALKNIKGTVVVVFISDESEEVEEEDITVKDGKLGATLEVVKLEDAE